MYKGRSNQDPKHCVNVTGICWESMSFLSVRFLCVFCMSYEGPLKISVQAAEFQQLWGSRSELRRFQDGAITEAVLWSGSSTCERRHILLEIITHLLDL